MAQTQISIDTDMLARLDATSLANSVSREEALREAIDNYCEYDRWFRSSVQRGLDDIRDGRVLSHEAVEREAEALLALYRREEIESPLDCKSSYGSPGPTQVHRTGQS